MISNGMITKVIAKHIEFLFSPKDETQFINQNTFEISRIRFGNGSAPLSLVKPNTQIFVEVINKQLKSISILKDFNVQVFYGQIQEVLDEDSCNIGSEFFYFKVPAEKITSNGAVQDKSGLRNKSDWYRVYTKSNLEVLEAQLISLNETISVTLEEFNRDSMNRLEVEMIHFKDSDSFSHFVHFRSVFDYNTRTLIDRTQVKDLIGTRSEIFINHGTLMAQVYPENPSNNFSLNFESKASICALNLAKSVRIKKINSSIVTDPESPKYDKYESRHSELQSFRNDFKVNLKYFKEGKLVYTTRRLFLFPCEIAGMFWVNSEVYNLYQSLSASFSLLVGILENCCRSEEVSLYSVVLQEMENYINEKDIPKSYLEIPEFLKHLYQDYEIQYRFIYLFEIIFSNLQFFQDFAIFLIDPSDFDFFALSRKFKVRFDVFERIQSELKRKVFEFPEGRNQEGAGKNSSILIYTDYKILFILYDTKLMLIDSYMIDQDAIKNCQILPDPSSISNLFKESLNFIRTPEPVCKLQSIETQILILESLFQSKPELFEDSIEELLLEAYQYRFESLKSLIHPDKRILS